MKATAERVLRRILINWSVPLTIFFVVVAACGAYVSKDIELKLSLTDLLPQDHPGVIKFNKLTEIVGGVGYMEILLRAEDGKSHLAVAPKLVEKYKQDPIVRSAFFARDEYFFLKHALYYLPIDKLREVETGVSKGIKRAKRQMFDIGIWGDEEPSKDETLKVSDEIKDFATRTAGLGPELLSTDGKYLLLLLKPSFDSMDMEGNKKLVALSERVLKETLPPNVSYVLSGRYYGKVHDAEILEKDIFVLGLLSNFVMAFLLFLYFRSIRVVISIFIPVVLGLGIAALLTWAVIGHINIITGFLVGIISGVGSDYGIHMAWRLRLEGREPSGPDPDPLWRTLLTSGWANFVTIISTVLCFSFMCFSSFKVFSEFGFICAVGLSGILFAKLGSFYCTSKLLNLEGEMRREKYPFSKYNLPILSNPLAFKLSLLGCLVLVLLASRVGFEFNFDKMMQHSKEVADAKELVDNIYGRSNTPSAFATDSRDRALEIETYIRDKYMPKTVQSFISGATLVPENQDAKAEVIAKLRKQIVNIKDKQLEKAAGLPAAAVRLWVEAKPFKYEEIPDYIRETMRGTKQAGYLMYVYPSEGLNNGPAVSRFAAFIKDIETRYPELVSGSDVGIFSDILELIKRDGLRICLAILLFVGVFIWLSLRNWQEAILCYVPFVMSLPMGIGLMAVCGVQFNIFNTAILPALVAVGIEIPIQLMQRAREIRQGYKAVRDVAVGLQLSLLTTALGFGTLVFTRAGVLKSLGWISLLSVTAIWLVGLFVQPAILERWFKRLKRA